MLQNLIFVERFDGDLLHDENFRKHITIPYLTLKYSLKILLVTLFLLFPFFIFSEMTFSGIILYFNLYSFIIYSVSPIIKWNYLANLCINFLHINPQKFVFDLLKINLIEITITSLLAIYLLNYYVGISYKKLVLLVIINIFTRLISEYINLWIKKRKIYIMNKLYRLGIVVILLSGSTFIFQLININDNILLINILSQISLCLTFILGFLSLLEIIYNTDFCYYSKKYLTKNYIKLEDSSIMEIFTAPNLVDLNKVRFNSKDIISEKKGIYYLHDLFHQRFLNVIKGRTNYIRNILIFLIIVLSILNIQKYFFETDFLFLQDTSEINMVYLMAISITILCNGTFNYLEHCNKEIDFKLSKHYWFYKKENIKHLFYLRENFIKELNKFNVLLIVILFILIYFLYFNAYSILEIIYLISLILMNNYFINNISLLMYYKLKMFNNDHKIMTKFMHIIEIITICFIILSNFLSLSISTKFLFIIIVFLFTSISKIIFLKSGDLS